MRVFINSLMLWFIIAAAGAEAASLSETIVEAIKSSSSTEAPSSTEVCQQDALTCADGSVLSRDPDLNCKFPRCSCGDSSECRRGECLEGYCKDVPDEVDDDDDGGNDDDDDGDDGDDDKSDDYEPSLCIQDVQECLDGSAVGRVPPYCEFEACPCSGSRDCYFGEICDSGNCMEDDRDSSCPLDTLECIDGSFVSRVPPACKFDRCSCSTSRECRRGVCFEGKCSDRSVQCTTDVKECDDGNVVGRVPPACDFEECSEAACPLDTLGCIDGSNVGRLPPDCDFARCSCRRDRDCYKGSCVDGYCSDDVEVYDDDEVPEED